LSGSELEAVKELDVAPSTEDGPVASNVNRTKRWLLSHSQHLNFFTILILASVSGLCPVWHPIMSTSLSNVFNAKIVHVMSSSKSTCTARLQHVKVMLWK
jgi:hypothetical protein